MSAKYSSTQQDTLRQPLLAVQPLEFSGRFASDRDVGSHRHSSLELVLVTSGACRIQVGRRWLEGGPGTLFTLPPQKIQYQQTLSFTRTTYIGFHIPANLFPHNARTIQLTPDSFAYRWVEELCDLHQAPSAAPQQASTYLLMALIAVLNNLEARQKAAAAMHPTVRDAVQIIADRLSETLQIRRLAEQVHLSPSHLRALFREQFGCSPKQHQQQLRMERAQRLLRDPYLSIQEVARQCGYIDASYFTRLFRKIHGMPPGQWRQQAGLDANLE